MSKNILSNKVVSVVHSPIC